MGRPKIEHFFCEKCNKYFNSSQALYNHKKSKTHENDIILKEKFILNNLIKLDSDEYITYIDKFNNTWRLNLKDKPVLIK